MDLRRFSTVTDFFVIGTAGSTPQLNALKEHIEAMLARHKASVWHIEGTVSPQPAARSSVELRWVLMDCGDVVVHLLNEQARSFYQLEQLWADAPRIPLSPTAASFGAAQPR